MLLDIACMQGVARTRMGLRIGKSNNIILFCNGERGGLQRNEFEIGGVVRGMMRCSSGGGLCRACSHSMTLAANAPN